MGSTINGYTAATAHCKGDPNYELVEQMVAELPCPVIAEGLTGRRAVLGNDAGMIGALRFWLDQQ